MSTAQKICKRFSILEGKVNTYVKKKRREKNCCTIEIKLILILYFYYCWFVSKQNLKSGYSFLTVYKKKLNTEN